MFFTKGIRADLNMQDDNVPQEGKNSDSWSMLARKEMTRKRYKVIDIEMQDAL